MPKFALTINEFAHGERKVYYSQLRQFLSLISQLSEGKRPSPGKIKKLKGLEDTYEMRSKDLRLYYLIIEEYDIIICLGDLKKSQNKSIRRLKSLTTQIKHQIEENGKIDIR